MIGIHPQPGSHKGSFADLGFFSHSFSPSSMSRGNRRDVDRQRAQKRKQKKAPKGGKSDNLTPAQRRER